MISGLAFLLSALYSGVANGVGAGIGPDFLQPFLIGPNVTEMIGHGE